MSLPNSLPNPDISLERALAEREADLERRTQLIIANTPADILAPTTATVAHRTIDELAPSILEHGLKVNGGVSSTASTLWQYTHNTELSDSENSAHRQAVIADNARILAKHHYQSNCVIIFRFPSHHPDHMPLYAQHNMQRLGYSRSEWGNAYLVRVPHHRDPTEHMYVIPPVYAVGTINQETGEFSVAPTRSFSSLDMLGMGLNAKRNDPVRAEKSNIMVRLQYLARVVLSRLRTHT